MSEEDFAVDGSEPGAPVYEKINPLKSGPDASAAAFNAELQSELDRAPALPQITQFQKIEQVRSGLMNYQRQHTPAFEPTHNLLDDNGGIALGTFKTEKVKQGPTYKTLEEAVLAQIKNGEMSKLDIDGAIFPQRKNIGEGNVPITRISVTRALESLIHKGLLQKNIDGTFSRPVKSILGGSDLSDKVKEVNKEVDKPVSKADRIKGVLADGAEWVEDHLNSGNIEGIDPSGEGFLGESNVSIPSRTTPEQRKGFKNPAYEEIVSRLQTLIKTVPPALAKTIKTFLHFKVEDKKLDEILKNLAQSKSLFPNEYSDLMHIAEEGINEEKKSKEILSGELPYPDGFVAEPPPLVELEEILPPPVVQESAPINEAFIEGIRIGAESWEAQHLEDELGNKLPLTAENYIKSVGGMLNPEIIHNVDRALSVLVERGIASKTSEGYEVKKISRITKRESVKEKVSGIPESLLSVLENLADHSDRPAAIKALIYSLKEPGVTKEQASMLLESSGVLDSETKKKLIDILFGVTIESKEELVPEPPPVVEQQEVVPPPLPVVEEEILPPPQVKISSEPRGEEYEKIDQELREKLKVAREIFAQEETKYKQKIRADKKAYQRLMTDLGVPGKQRQLTPPDQDYLEAQKQYKDASKALKSHIAGQSIKEIEEFSRAHSSSIVEQVRIKRIDIGVLEQEETERRLLKKMIEERMPLKEKGIATKAFEKWASYPLGARVALSATFFTIATGGVGTVGGTLAAITLRTARGVFGAGTAMAAATAFDGIKRKKIEEERKKAFEEYATLGSESEEERDEKLDTYLDKEENQIKRDRVKKAALAAAVGGIATAGAGLVQGAVIETASGPGIKVNPNIDPARSKIAGIGEKPSVDKLLRQIPEKTVEAPASKVYVEPVKVDLSSKGFIDTVRGLKEQLVGKTMSPKLAELMSQKPEKIAMDLGLFKPGQAAESAFGLKNEYLAVDAEGEISLVHSDGSTVNLFDGEKVKPYVGKMFDADKLATSPVPTDAEVPTAPKVAEVMPQTPKPVVEVVPEVSPIEIKSFVSRGEAVADAAVTTPAVVEVKPRATIDFDQTVVKSSEYTGPKDMISGKMPLKPEFQFDPKYKPERTAYNIKLEKELMSMPSDMFDLRFPIEYNGGRINVFQKGKDLLILLNGQKIGTGVMIDGQPGLQYEKSLGTSLFGVKSDFEKAFEEASKGIMKNKMFFKKTQ